MCKENSDFYQKTIINGPDNMELVGALALGGEVKFQLKEGNEYISVCIIGLHSCHIGGKCDDWVILGKFGFENSENIYHTYIVSRYDSLRKTGNIFARLVNTMEENNPFIALDLKDWFVFR